MPTAHSTLTPTIINIGMGALAIRYEIEWGESGVSENLEIVAMVLDMETGEILNAEKAKVVDTTSGIRETSADASLRLYADGGRIVAEGECSAVEVYTLQGVAVANGGLQRGVYIVRATTPDGAVSRKVLVE